MTTATEALDALIDPEAQAVEAWHRRLFPPKNADPLAVAREIVERKELVAELTAAAKVENKQAKADADAMRKIEEVQAKAESDEIASWGATLYPARK